MNSDQLKAWLDQKATAFNRQDFIEHDPIGVPHRFSKLQDIEIAGFWAATLAWGQRKTIIANSLKLMELMDHAPHDFVVNHNERERERFLTFVHRTFQPTDTLYFLAFFQTYYQNNASLETAFSRHLSPGDLTIENALKGFHEDFFSLEFAPQRTRKHVATPTSGSACKRLCMYLRWMVRNDANGVDFGLWKQISPAQLVTPLDVHVERVARHLGLLQHKNSGWPSALELTASLREFDAQDPVKYDFALFGAGASGLV